MYEHVRIGIFYCSVT